LNFTIKILTWSCPKF